MKLFGWLLHCVQTSFDVKIHFKISSSTARTKIRLEKDTYSLWKVHFILVPKMLFFFLSSIPLTSFSCLLMIHIDGIIWMAFALCPNQFYVKIHLKTSSSIARTTTTLEKDTYSLWKVHFILVPKMLFFFSIFNSTYFFQLFAHDSHWWNYLDGFCVVSKPVLCKNTLKNQFQYCSYHNYTWKRHLFTLKSTLHSSIKNVCFFFYLQFHLLLSVVCSWFTLMELFGWLSH